MRLSSTCTCLPLTRPRSKCPRSTPLPLTPLPLTHPCSMCPRWTPLPLTPLPLTHPCSKCPRSTPLPLTPLPLTHPCSMCPRWTLPPLTMFLVGRAMVTLCDALFSHHWGRGGSRATSNSNSNLYSGANATHTSTKSVQGYVRALTEEVDRRVLAEDQESPTYSIMADKVSYVRPDWHHPVERCRGGQRHVGDHHLCDRCRDTAERARHRQDEKPVARWRQYFQRCQEWCRCSTKKF